MSQISSPLSLVKKRLPSQQNLLVRESLEIRRLKTSTNAGLNDPQLAVRSNAWDPVLKKLKDWLFSWTGSFNVYRGGGPERSLSLSFIPFYVCLFFGDHWLVSSLSLFILHLLSLFLSSLFPSLVIPFANELWHSHMCRKFWLSLSNKCMWILISDVILHSILYTIHMMSSLKQFNYINQQKETIPEQKKSMNLKE